MFKKLLALTCALAFIGCEQNDSTNAPDDNAYTFSDKITVGSVSEPITDKSGDWAQIDSREGTFVVMITDNVHLQRLKTDNTGYMDIPSSQYTIITPGDELQFAYNNDQIEWGPRPPVVRPSTIRIMK